MMKTGHQWLKFRLWAAALLLPVFGVRAGVTFTSLYAFTGGGDGSNPQAALVQGSDGLFYGTAFNGGANSAGVVFKISTSGALTTVYSFSGGSDGLNPQAGLIQASDGFFYGTTQSGGKPTNGSPAGTIIQLSPTGILTNLYSFNVDTVGGNDGSYPQARLVQGSDGYLYGTTFEGGTYGFANSATNGFGSVFKISTSGALTNLYPFSGGNDGAYPAGGLVQGSDGNFYGMTQAGGNSNSGTIFKISASGVLTTLYSFTGGNDGGGPIGELVQGGDGSFYGTTAGGGTNGFGTVFKISSSGTLTSLYSFNGSDAGENPQTGLALGSDGNFYGTTQSGGNGGGGTLFKITAKGALTTLYSFTGGNDGSNPQAALVQGSDGAFYGTTFNGGPSGAGTVFRLSVGLVGQPKLTIGASGANVVLKWPTTAVGFILQSTSNFASPVAWATNSAPPVVINGQNTVTIPISGPQRFFRLAQ